MTTFIDTKTTRAITFYEVVLVFGPFFWQWYLYFIVNIKTSKKYFFVVEKIRHVVSVRKKLEIIDVSATNVTFVPKGKIESNFLSTPTE